jgi:outer membrane protein TolC
MAQERAPLRLRLNEAITLARKNLPAIQEAQANISAATASQEMVRLSSLPKAELNWQQTRGTRNNIFGQFFPQAAIPPISGPVIGEPTLAESAWGSGGGLLISWEPFDFGVREAERTVAGRIVAEAEARRELTEMEAALGAADAFLRAVAAGQVVRTAESHLTRMEIFAQTVAALVANDLRPGAEKSRVEVEVAIARTQLIEAREQAGLALVHLSTSIGLAGEPIQLEETELLMAELLMGGSGGALQAPHPAGALEKGEEGRSGSTHPLLRFRQASVATSLARQEQLGRSFRPRFHWQTAFFARGSGARLDGRILWNRGFYPETANWATAF